MSRQVHLGRLLGRKVYDPSGQCAGRIEEVHAHETEKGECVIDEYMLGEEALMERLSFSGAAGFFVHRLGGRHHAPSHKVPWDKMDLSDPRHPKVRCAAEDLEKAE